MEVESLVSCLENRRPVIASVQDVVNPFATLNAWLARHQLQSNERSSIRQSVFTFLFPLTPSEVASQKNPMKHLDGDINIDTTYVCLE